MKPVHAILLVEDNPADIKITERALRESALPVELIVVRDGQEAIDYLSHQGNFTDTTCHPAPKLMLLDLKMPRKNGFEVLEWLRQQPALRPLIVVVLSSSDLADDVNRAYDLGANSYLVKPGDFEALINMVKTLDAYWLKLNQQVDPVADLNPVPLVAPVQCAAL